MSFYGYKNNPVGLGIGVEKLGFQQPTTLPIDSIYAARYNVRETLDPYSGAGLIRGVNLHGQFRQSEIVDVSLRGNGLYFAGDLALEALIEFEKAKANG